jgi:hypothetical protein
LSGCRGRASSFAHACNKTNQRIGRTVTGNGWPNCATAAPSAVNDTANVCELTYRNNRPAGSAILNTKRPKA